MPLFHAGAKLAESWFRRVEVVVHAASLIFPPLQSMRRILFYEKVEACSFMGTNGKLDDDDCSK